MRFVSFEDDEFTARVAHSEKEVCALVEAGLFLNFVSSYHWSGA